MQKVTRRARFDNAVSALTSPLGMIAVTTAGDRVMLQSLIQSPLQLFEHMYSLAEGCRRDREGLFRLPPNPIFCHYGDVRQSHCLPPLASLRV